jgi:hypothetical protein
MRLTHSADSFAAHIDLLAAARGKRFGTILADPPWQFQNRTARLRPSTSGSTATGRSPSTRFARCRWRTSPLEILVIGDK